MSLDVRMFQMLAQQHPLSPASQQPKCYEEIQSAVMQAQYKVK